MDTKTVQLIGNPKDGYLMDVTAKEIRGNESVYVPYYPEGENAFYDVAMAEYKRFIAGTPKGQLMLWVNPHMQHQTLENVVSDLLSGDRSGEGVWVLQGAGFDGKLQMMPLRSAQ